MCCRILPSLDGIFIEYAVRRFMESKRLIILMNNLGILCLNAANKLNRFIENKIYGVEFFSQSFVQLENKKLCDINNLQTKFLCNK